MTGSGVKSIVARGSCRTMGDIKNPTENVLGVYTEKTCLEILKRVNKFCDLVHMGLYRKNMVRDTGFLKNEYLKHYFSLHRPI